MIPRLVYRRNPAVKDRGDSERGRGGGGGDGGKVLKIKGLLKASEQAKEWRQMEKEGEEEGEGGVKLSFAHHL